MPFAARIPVTSEHIMYQMVAALEGGCNYWIGRVRLTQPSKDTLPDPELWYACQELYDQDFVIEIQEDEDGQEPDLWRKLTPVEVQRGLDWLGETRPQRIAEIVGDGDAETADVFLQACLFGDIVYG